MSFSDVFRIERDVFKFSFDGKYIAYAFQNNVFVRNAQNSRIVRSFPALDIVQYIEWSRDSKFILCALYKRGVIQVLSLQFPKWKCKIRECEIGIKKALWSPDSRHILTVGNFNVWACIWSLSDLSVKYIYNLKSIAQPVLEFSQNGKWLAVIERYENTNCISTFSTASWHLSKRYPCDKIDIIGGLSWSPDCHAICVWDKRIDLLRVQIISLVKDTIYTFERASLGVKTIAWSPSGQLLAIGCHDRKVRLLNHITWSQVAVLDHVNTIDSPACTVFKEIPLDSLSVENKKKESNTSVSHRTVFKEVAVRPVAISSQHEDCEVASSHCSVWLNCFSSCGYFLVSSCDTMPATLWIWSVKTFTLHTFLAFSIPVVDVAWDPGTLRLAAVSESTNVCLWTPASGASVVKTPESDLWDVCVSGIKWHPQGHTLALNTRNTLMLLWFSGDTEFN